MRYATSLLSLLDCLLYGKAVDRSPGAADYPTGHIGSKGVDVRCATLFGEGAEVKSVKRGRGE